MLSAKPFRKIAWLACMLFFAACAVKKDPEKPESLFPKSIENLKAQVIDGCADLNWKYKGAPVPEKIVILRNESKSANQGWSDLKELTEVKGGSETYRDCSIAAGNFYSYQVRGVSRAKIQSEDGAAARISAPKFPGMPANSQAVPGDRFIDLSWNLEPETAYNLYRGMEPQKFSDKPANPLPVTRDKFSDLGLENGKTYFYCLRPVLLPEGFPPVEGPCAFASASPVDLIAPMPPRGLAAALTPQGVLLQWFKSPEPDILGYLVFRRPAGAASWKQLTSDPIPDTQYLDSAPGLKGKFEYALKAVDNAPSRNRSEMSQPESVTLP